MGTSGTLAIKATPGQTGNSQIATQACPSAGVSDGGQSVRTAMSSLLRRGRDAGLPSDGCLPSGVEQLLADVVADGFVVYCCGPRRAPWALMASYQWDDYVDLLSIRRFDRIITARVAAPHRAEIDVFNPQTVVWAYEGPPWPALRALLDLLPPDHPDAPTRAYPAPPGLRIPRAQQRPLTLRLPPPQCVTHRADRLAVLTAHGSQRLTRADSGRGAIRC